MRFSIHYGIRVAHTVTFFTAFYFPYTGCHLRPAITVYGVAVSCAGVPVRMYLSTAECFNRKPFCNIYGGML